jgi:hypothetical protein
MMTEDPPRVGRVAIGRYARLSKIYYRRRLYFSCSTGERRSLIFFRTNAGFWFESLNFLNKYRGLSSGSRRRLIRFPVAYNQRQLGLLK